MHRTISLLLAFGLSSVLSVGSLRAAEQPSPAELRMREQLRAVMLQLRTSETERATLQAAQADLEQKNTMLTTQVETLTKQMATEKEASEKSIAELKGVVQARDGQIAQLTDTLDQWKMAHKKAVEVATTTEAQRAKLAAKVVLLDRRVADQQTKNAAMYKIGTEILSRYEKFGLGDALTAKEPFIGITKVKFENLIQDYTDGLTDAKIKPEEKPKTEEKAKPDEQKKPSSASAAQKPAATPAKSSKGKAATANTAGAKSKS
jgi:hypothetical protein